MHNAAKPSAEGITGTVSFPHFLATFGGSLQSSKQKRFALAAMFVESLSLEGQWTICLFGTVAFAMMRGCTV